MDKLLHAILQLLNCVLLLHDFYPCLQHLLEQLILFLVYYAHFCVFFFDYPVATLLLLLHFIDESLLTICYIFEC